MHEINDLVLLDKIFEIEGLINGINELDKLGKDLEVGGQTSFQNKVFILNETDFPTGTSGRSRQAIYEISKRINSLKDLVFEYHSTIANIKKEKASIMSLEKDFEEAKKKYDHSELEIELLKVEADLDLAKIELRKYEISLENQRLKSRHLLRSIKDFEEEFHKNEEECKKQGFNISYWNNFEIENHYWQIVNDRKLVKSRMYEKAKLSKEIGDGLPLQNTLDVNRINQIDKHIEKQFVESNESNESNETKEIQGQVNWDLIIEGKTVKSSECPFRENDLCKARKEMVGKCTKNYCLSLGFCKN